MKEKKDCFAYLKDGCGRLNDTYCRFEECKFYMSQEEYEERLKEKEMKLIKSGYYAKGKESKEC